MFGDLWDVRYTFACSSWRSCFHLNSFKRQKEKCWCMHTGVTCHFSLHAKLPFRGKMEWICHSILPISCAHLPCMLFSHAKYVPLCISMGKYIAFYVVLITKLVTVLVTIPTVVVVIVVIQITCNHDCSHIF